MSQFKWNPTALDDLQRIAEFIRQYSPAKEQLLIGAIIEQANQLRALPRSGQKRETLADGSESRSLLVGKYYRLSVCSCAQR